MSATQVGPAPLMTYDDFGPLWDEGRAIHEIHQAVQLLRYYIGTWYKWGGETPGGFDCSGLACEYLKMLGIMSRRADASAQRLCEVLPRHIQQRVFRVGDLVFFGKMWNEITHVEICITRYMSLGATGGGSKTLSVADAMRDRAWVKIRPIVNGRGGNPVQYFGDVTAALTKTFATRQPLF